MKIKNAMLAGAGLTVAASIANAQMVTITPEEPLTILFRTPAGASPTPDMMTVLFGLTEAGGTGLRTAEIYDEGELLGTHENAVFGGYVGPLNLDPGVCFREPTSIWDFFEAGDLDMSSFIDGTEDGKIIWRIESGFLEFDAANLRMDWGQGFQPSWYYNSTPTPQVIDFFVGEIVECRVDLDGDGSLTIFDFLAYQNAFDAGDPMADFDGDGELTIFDFLAFQNEFDAGCE
ncbi:MAG: GC-type dockerin domain-anchored protein [Phycisphaerales bacterium JB060]